MCDDVEVARRLISQYDRAKDRKIECSLSFPHMKRLLSAKHCYVTGREFGEGELTRTLERLDNSKGYVDNNVVACISRVNSGKNNLTPLEIKQLFNALKKKKIL